MCGVCFANTDTPPHLPPAHRTLHPCHSSSGRIPPATRPAEEAPLSPPSAQQPIRTHYAHARQPPIGSILNPPGKINHTHSPFLVPDGREIGEAGWLCAHIRTRMRCEHTGRFPLHHSPAPDTNTSTSPPPHTTLPFSANLADSSPPPPTHTHPFLPVFLQTSHPIPSRHPTTALAFITSFVSTRNPQFLTVFLPFPLFV